MKLFTIGFTQKSAETFFTTLQQVGVHRIVDIRLNNTSQLAGFAKARDLQYFLMAIGGIAYTHQPEFAPTPELLEEYKKNKGSWEKYEASYASLMERRRADDLVVNVLRDGDCLLCSEAEPTHCHRRLLAERVQKCMENLEIVHL